MQKDYDVAIVGGGPAGLSAALVLARCRRRVWICDDGHPRNAASSAVHCLLGNEGISPSELLARAREELSAFSHLAFRTDQVLSINRADHGFVVTCPGETAIARKVLLTTGLKDEIPNIEGIDRFYGRSVHHCPYCDGFEHRDQPIAVYGKSEKGAGLALMMKNWSADVVLCSADGMPIAPDTKEVLEQHEIAFFRQPLVKLEGDQYGNLRRIYFADGSSLERSAFFFNTGCAQRSDLSEKLGCKRDQKGGVIVDPLTEETSAAGVYVAGDVSRDVLLIAVAIAEGAKAAVAINRALLGEDGLG